MTNIRFLSAQQVQTALPMSAAVDAMRSAFGQLSAGKATMPQRATVQSGKGTTLVMPAYLADSDDLAIKIVSVYPENTAQKLPLIFGLVTVLDAQTGTPLAVMDAAYLTALRTGAGSGLATELLARDDADTLALFGVGAQARTQLEAVCTARDVKAVRIFAPDAGRVEAFIKEMAGQGPIPAAAALQVAASPTEALEGASLLIAATTSSQPIFDGDDLMPGAHINGVGSWQPSMQELDEKTVSRAKIVVDSREAAWEEAGELIIARDKGVISEDDIHAELGEIVNGTRPGRESEDEITFFKSVGVAAQDAAIAAAILQAAAEKNIGTLVEL